MAKYISIIDPTKKKPANMQGSAAVLTRNKKGDIETIKKDDYAGVSDASINEDTSRMQGNGNFSGGPAPMSGGEAPKKTGMANGTSKRKMIKDSIRRVKQSSASPQAKRSAFNAYKR